MMTPEICRQKYLIGHAGVVKRRAVWRLHGKCYEYIG